MLRAQPRQSAAVAQQRCRYIIWQLSLLYVLLDSALFSLQIQASLLPSPCLALVLPHASIVKDAGHYRCNLSNLRTLEDVAVVSQKVALRMLGAARPDRGNGWIASVAAGTR